MMKTKKLFPLIVAILFLFSGIFLTSCSAYKKTAFNYEEKLASAELMQQWMDIIKKEKLQKRLPISEEDWHDTGLLGEEYTFITTTHGAVEAKRTTLNPDMAALVVQMLDDAGISSGDTVGAGFSGSFPAMNLAVLAACQTLHINCIYIASIGSSTYGANQEDYTFPDMIHTLLEKGVLEMPPVLITTGGYDDCGYDMDTDLRNQIINRIHGYGYPFLMEPDFEKNIAHRMELYAANGPITCFIGVGGNLTTSGDAVSLPYGVINPDTTVESTEKNGLIQRYHAAGLPVLHILNIKELVTDYGLDYDPVIPLSIGESALYFETTYSRIPAFLSIIAAIVVLLTSYKIKR